jgi:hypothetical protein
MIPAMTLSLGHIHEIVGLRSNYLAGKPSNRVLGQLTERLGIEKGRSAEPIAR